MQNNYSKRFRLILVAFTSLINICFLQAQETDEASLNQNVEFYKLLFDQDTILDSNTGSLYLPGNFKQLSDSSDLLLLSFERNFDLSNPNIEHKIVFEKGIMDEGMVLINGKFINNKPIAEGDISSHESIIPRGFLKKGNNTIKILALSYSERGDIKGDFYIKHNGNERIDLAGTWDYKIYDENQNAMNIKPTQFVNISSLYNFNLDSYNSKNFDHTDWPQTNFPVSIEKLYNNNKLDGAVWFRKKLTLNNLPTSDMYINIPEGIDDYDRLYVNGKLVGVTNCYNCPRKYRVPKEYFKKNNVFALLVIDNDGIGGVRGKVTLSNNIDVLDLSNEWSYKKVLDLQILVTIKENKDQASLFDENEIGIFSLSGEKLNFDNILIEEKSYFYLYIITVIAIIILMFILYYRIRKLKTIDEEVKTSIESINKHKDIKHIFIRADRANHKIEIQNILLVEGKKDYVKLHMSATHFLVRKNLKKFLLELPPTKFIRISKSVAVNVDQINKIDKNMLFLKNNNYYIIGKRYLEEVKSLVR